MTRKKVLIHAQALEAHLLDTDNRWARDLEKLLRRLMRENGKDECMKLRKSDIASFLID